MAAGELVAGGAAGEGEGGVPMEAVEDCIHVDVGVDEGHEDRELWEGVDAFGDIFDLGLYPVEAVDVEAGLLGIQWPQSFE